MRLAGAGLVLFALALGAEEGRAGNPASISWLTDRSAVTKLAMEKNKLVLDFNLIGDLDRPDC